MTNILDKYIQNGSAEGWWVASLVERFAFEGEDKSNKNRRCRAFSNVVMFKAKNREQAYKKAIKYGQDGNDDLPEWSAFGRRGTWIFVGIESLLPVKEEMDPDGTEICFDDFENITVGKVESWVKEKNDLEAFDDSRK